MKSGFSLAVKARKPSETSGESECFIAAASAASIASYSETSRASRSDCLISAMAAIGAAASTVGERPCPHGQHQHAERRASQGPTRRLACRQVRGPTSAIRERDLRRCVASSAPSHRARKHTEENLRKRDARVLGCHDKIATQSKLQSAAHCGSLDRGDCGDV